MLQDSLNHEAGVLWSPLTTSWDLGLPPTGCATLDNSYHLSQFVPSSRKRILLDSLGSEILQFLPMPVNAERDSPFAASVPRLAKPGGVQGTKNPEAYIVITICHSHQPHWGCRVTTGWVAALTLIFLESSWAWP